MDFNGRMAGEMPRRTKLDDIQDAAQWAGMVPGVGSIIDLGNSALYAARGKWGDAAMTALGAVPLIGDIAQLGRKLGKGTQRLM